MARLFFQRLASFSRLIRFDRRGTGGSDPVPLNGLPPWESYVEELLCVMDEVGSERAAMMVAYDAGPMGMLFAATKPERTTSLVLLNTTAKYVVSHDYPIGLPREIAEQMVDQIGDVWGTEAQVYLSVPSRAEDPRFRQWYAKLLRAIASPAAAQAYYRAVFDADARPLLPSIHVPTLVIQRTDTPFIPMAQGRYLADHIEGAKFLEIPGSDVPVIWEHPDLVLEAVEEFLTGVRRGEEPDRMLATVLFTDIVDSTRRARELGDRRWRGLLDAHDEVTRRLIEEYGGPADQVDGGRHPGHFRRPGERRPLCDGAPRRTPRVGPGDPRGPPHGGDRTPRRRRRRDGRPHRSSSDGGCGDGGDSRLEDSPGPDSWLRHRLQRSGDARPERGRGGLAIVRGGMIMFDHQCAAETVPHEITP